MTIPLIDDPRAVDALGARGLVGLLPTATLPSIVVRKGILEILVTGILARCRVHLSGPSGTGKSSLIDALAAPLPDRTGLSNFELARRALIPAGSKTAPPLRLFPVEMCRFETPAELYTRRALRNGETYDEPSPLVDAIAAASEVTETALPVIWLRELGRVHAANVMSGLLNLVTRAEILLPDGRRPRGDRIGWIADSNYAASADDHTLVTFDAALRRRFEINLTLDPLEAGEEAAVLRDAVNTGGTATDENLITAAVTLGRIVRRHQNEGQLHSLPPPSVQGYTAFTSLAAALPHRDWRDIALATLLGNADHEDTPLVGQVLAEAAETFDGPTSGRAARKHPAELLL